MHKFCAWPRLKKYLQRMVCILATAVAFSDKVFAEYQESEITKVAMLGTGTPNPDPNRSGAAIAIIVNQQTYLFDFGTGVVRNAKAVFDQLGDAQTSGITSIEHAFLTHMHSDHSLGLADLLLTPWVMGRSEPLNLYGPEGITDMANNLLNAYSADIDYRVNGPEAANDQGWRANTFEIEEGEVYRDENIGVEAFRVRHGEMENAFGYRISTPDRIIVISGDTAPNPNIESFSQGADILIHGVYSERGVSFSSPIWQSYMRANHTSSQELGSLAAMVEPDLVVLYHALLMGATEEEILAEVGQQFQGNLVLAKDLDVF